MKHVWGRIKVHIGFQWGKQRDGDHLENRGVNDRIILIGILETWDGGRDWIDLAQDRDRWRALLDAVIDFRFP